MSKSPSPSDAPLAPVGLPQDYLASLVAQFAGGQGSNVHAIALTGSYARGEADAFSDVDLRCLVHHLPERESERHWIGCLGERLVSVTYETMESKRAEFRSPGVAIFAIPTCRTMRLLLDRDDQLAALRQEALEFTWAPLQPAADKRASGLLADMAEVAYKALGGLTTRNADRVIYATWELVSELTWIVALQRGVLITSDRHYFRLVREAVGETSAWTREHRLASGVETNGGSFDREPYAERGTAAVRLYDETAQLLQPILEDDHRQVVDGVLRTIVACHM